MAWSSSAYSNIRNAYNYNVNLSNGNDNVNANNRYNGNDNRSLVLARYFEPGRGPHIPPCLAIYMPGNRKNRKFEEPDVYHKCQNLTRSYTALSVNFPLALLGVNQRIHLDLLNLSGEVFDAANAPKNEKTEKALHLINALFHIKRLYNDFKQALWERAISENKWAEVSKELMDIYEDITSWAEAMVPGVTANPRAKGIYGGFSVIETSAFTSLQQAVERLEVSLKNAVHAQGLPV